jgi:CheY-like chemotaxis protein
MPGRDRPARVLHVEDEQDFQDLVRTSIEKSGAKIELTLAVTLAGALLAIEAARRASRQFDVVLLDLKMPYSEEEPNRVLPELDVLEAIKAATHVPVVILTGSDDPNLFAECRKRKVAGLLFKDEFDIATVGECVIQAINARLGDIDVEREARNMAEVSIRAKREALERDISENQVGLSQLDEQEQELRDIADRLANAIPLRMNS